MCVFDIRILSFAVHKRGWAEKWRRKEEFSSHKTFAIEKLDKFRISFQETHYFRFTILSTKWKSNLDEHLDGGKSFPFFGEVHL